MRIQAKDAMVSIHVDGEDRTAQISDWAIKMDRKRGPQLTCHFPSGKTYTRDLSACSVLPTRELHHVLLKKSGSAIVTAVAKAIIHGERYAVVQFPGSELEYVYDMQSVTFSAPTEMKGGQVFRYLSAVANARRERAGSGADRDIADNVVRQFDRVPASAESVLQAYCTGRAVTLAPGQGLIFPFGLNESQLTAVENAFHAQVSVIEGPPGTGKTQTILNILANIVLRGQTVAVLSNNNAAVENVYEKLHKHGLGYLCAKLGNKDNRNQFFAEVPPPPLIELGSEPVPSLDEVQAILATLKQYLRDNHQAARLQVELDELSVERRYLQEWLEEAGIQSVVSLEKYGLSPPAITDLMAYLAHLGERRVRLRDRMELLFSFRILRANRLVGDEARFAVFHALQLAYYDKVMQEKQAQLQKCRESLAEGKFEALQESLTTASMRHLKQHLKAQPQQSERFEADTYRMPKQFDAFLRRFPILGSSTHSIVNSIAPGTILDYVIIDEASLQDIVPGVLALGCAKNLVVVGDNRQLAHIPIQIGLQAPAEAYDCERYSLLDSCIGAFQGGVPRTLLREHYRCHPKIIQFCNQQFYDNALVPMTQDKGEASLRLVVTAKGNHARKNTNLRELDSLLKLLEREGDPAGIDGDGRGFIAPYRAQVDLSATRLPGDFAKDTVHKFQGRECDEIVFSTVLDRKRYNQQRERLDFVDDARMINVAVSRAKHRFTLVTGDEVFTSNNGNIAALVRYVTYYAQEDQVVTAPVVSAFDLLYREYDQSLARLNARLRPEDSRYRSEQIAAQLLRDALSVPSCHALMHHDQVKLNQVVSIRHPDFTERERAFMQRASCDFVIYFKVGKAPLGVMEVDGGSHDRSDQAARDALKDGILAKCGIPVLRLRTGDSGIEERIAGFIAQWARPVPGGRVADEVSSSGA